MDPTSTPPDRLDELLRRCQRVETANRRLRKLVLGLAAAVAALLAVEALQYAGMVFKCRDMYQALQESAEGLRQAQAAEQARKEADAVQVPQNVLLVRLQLQKATWMLANSIVINSTIEPGHDDIADFAEKPLGSGKHKEYEEHMFRLLPSEAEADHGISTHEEKRRLLEPQRQRGENAPPP